MIENTKAAPAATRLASWRHNTAPNQNGVDARLSRLDKVRASGQGRWMARCPAHGDKGASLSVRELADGRVLVHCFGGCDVQAVVGAVGMELSDLFPPDDKKRDWNEPSKPKVKPAFYASDLLRIASFECLVVMLAAYDMRKGKQLSDEDMERLKVAQQRIEEVVHYAGV